MTALTWEAREERLLGALVEYADHQSWRCGHPDRYPWEPDCPCGLTQVLRSFGLDDKRGRAADTAAPTDNRR